MKKFFAILLAGVLTVGLAACGGSDDAATNDDSNKEEITLKIGASPCRIPIIWYSRAAVKMSLFWGR